MSRMLTVYDASTGDAIDEVSKVGWNTIDSWLEEMTGLHSGRRWLVRHRRVEILRQAQVMLRKRRDEMALLIAAEGGKPLKDAKVEVERAIGGFDIAIAQVLSRRGEQIPMDLMPGSEDRIAYTTEEPIGPVVAISAFNHPLNLAVHQVVPAVAAGCPVIIKPAGATPLCVRELIGILHAAGLPEEYCRFAPCDVSVAESMATDARTRFLSFIGSARVGWHLKSKLSPGTHCALEHGGVAPVVVDEHADIDAIIAPLTRGAYYHSGQVCVSVQRIFAPRSVASDLAARLAESASKLIVGDAKSPETDCGPMIQPAEAARVAEWIERAGTRPVCGGNRIGDRFVKPTVLLDPDSDAEVSTQEVFGPVACVYSCDTAEEAIARANALPFTFQAAVFSNRMNFAHRAIRELEATTVVVNDSTAFRVDWMPFGGRRQSGYGMGGIPESIHEMSVEKLAVIRP